MDFWIKPNRAYTRAKTDPDNEETHAEGSTLSIHSATDDAPDSVQERPLDFQEVLASLPTVRTSRKRNRHGKKFRPMADYRSFVQRIDIGTPEPLEDSNSRQSIESGQSVESKENDELTSREFPVLKFPYIDDGEINKHQTFMTEMKPAKMKTSGPYDSYFEIVKRQCEAQSEVERLLKQKTQREEETVPTPKLVRKQPSWILDLNEDSKSDKNVPVEPPPPPKWKMDMASRVVLDFKYSRAVEQYFRHQLRINKRKYRKRDFDDRTEIKFGFLVTTLGPNVLNLQARTLPSCNPLEARMRKHRERQNAMFSKKKQTG